MHDLLAAVPHPIVVPPDVLALVDDRRGMRCGLGEARHGIGLEAPDAVGPQYLELVEAASAGSFDEQRPNSGSGHQLHIVPLAVPVIEVADEPHGLRVGRPDREARAGDCPAFGILEVYFVGTQPAPALGVVSFVETGEVPASQTAARIVGHECYSCSLVGLASSPDSLGGLASLPGWVGTCLISPKGGAESDPPESP